MYECLLLIIHHYDHFHTTVPTFCYGFWFCCEQLGELLLQFKLLDSHSYYIILFIDCHGLSLYLLFPVIEICERYFRNLKLRSL